ncbi:MAG: penicillin-binding transpeptidase domain-containing protein, partial [Actinomycetota bacterium]|nr:penicillin-binding transpeptidase domain-containing protein [Actinomycetota bacterium]
MNEQLSRRLAFLGVLIVGLFAALFTRAWYLQVLTSEELAEKAFLNHVEIVVTQPTRGRILDRHGVVLADNIRTGVVTVNQSRYAPGQVDYVLEQISELIDIPVPTLSSRLLDQQTHPLAAKVVATGLDEYGLLRVSEKSLPGVEAKWVMSRVYPQNEIGAHVIGYVGAMSQGQEDRLLKQDYLPSERVGKSGIEQIFEADLHGHPGRTELEVDSTGRVHRIVSQTAPKPGSDVYLTIDADLQAATESYLRQGLIAARKTVSDDSGFFYPSIGGAAVVMDLRNGDVLAMASHPTYDPNWLVGGITTLEYQSVFENPYAPGALNNRAVQGLYSPGSVFKLVTALAGLEARLISPRAAYYDIGYFKIPDKYGCTGRCTFYNADKAPLGIVDLSSAITRSSDA